MSTYMEQFLQGNALLRHLLMQGCIFPSEIKTFPWCARKFSKLFRNFNFKITVISRLKTGSGRLFSNYHSTFEKKFWFPKICEFFKKCYTFKAKFMNFFEKIVKTFPEISQISKLCRDDYHRRMWNMHPCDPTPSTINICMVCVLYIFFS